MVRINVLNDCLRSMVNAERKGKRQVSERTETRGDESPHARTHAREPRGWGPGGGGGGGGGGRGRGGEGERQKKEARRDAGVRSGRDTRVLRNGEGILEARTHEIPCRAWGPSPRFAFLHEPQPHPDPDPLE